MFLRPFGLYCSVCFGSLFVSILCTCCSHFFWYCFISFTMLDGEGGGSRYKLSGLKYFAYVFVFIDGTIFVNFSNYPFQAKPKSLCNGEPFQINVKVSSRSHIIGVPKTLFSFTRARNNSRRPCQWNHKSSPFNCRYVLCNPNMKPTM
jgi:hypothetical protein